MDTQTQVAPADPVKRLLTPSEVSVEYGFAEVTLRKWRYEGQGPAWIKTSTERTAPVRYRRSAIEAWLDDHTYTPTGSQAA